MEHPEVFCPASKYDLKQDTLQPIYPLVTGCYQSRSDESSQAGVGRV